MRATLSILIIAFAIVLNGCANESVEKTRESRPIPAAQLSPQEAEMLDVASKGNTSRVKELLDSGVSVNMRGVDGNTPIMEAAYAGHLDTVKLLMDRGADLSAKKRDGATPLALASKKEISDLFKSVGSLVSAAYAGNNQIVEGFISKGTPLNALDETGQNALHAACWSGKTDTVKLLLDRGADPQIKKADGASPLALAMGQKHEPIVALLKQAIAEKEQATSNTPKPNGSPAK